MSAPRFVARAAEDAALIGEIHALSPLNPLGTSAYVGARTRLGAKPWAFALQDGRTLRAACFGFLDGRGAHLEIPSVPDVPSESPLWEGLHLWLRQNGVRSCELASFGSERASLPVWPGEQTRRARTEWVVELDGAPVKVSSGHRRNARKAEAAGARIRLGASEDFLAAHVRCMESSLDRRDARGEDVPNLVSGAPQRAFLEAGAGEVAQVVLDGAVVASILLLRSAEGAYYQSAGGTPAGRDIGAAQYLVLELMDRLRSEGVRRFNLGGAQDDNPGLQRFKRGFGARAVPLETASFSTASATLRKLKALGRRARDLLAVGA